MTDPRSEVEVVREALQEAAYVEPSAFAALASLEAENERLTKERDEANERLRQAFRFDGKTWLEQRLEARLNEAREALRQVGLYAERIGMPDLADELAAALASITDPEGGE